MTNSSSQITPSADAERALLDGMAQLGLKPLWHLYTQLVKREPQMSEPARSWRWRDMEPLVSLAAQQVRGEAADHRALILAHPAFAPRVMTTTNLIAAMQCVLPGERTIEHRHTASACRLILEGDGGFTLVDGRRCAMQPKDFIITPNWTWHAHQNDGTSRSVWLDMLDVPLMGALDTTFGGPGPATGYPAVPRRSDGRIEPGARPKDTPFADAARGGVEPHALPPPVQLRWAWADVVAGLQAAPANEDGSRSLRYLNPLDGNGALPTLDATAIELTDSRWTRSERRSSNAILVVLEGEGESEVGGTLIHLGRTRRDHAAALAMGASPFAAPDVAPASGIGRGSIASACARTCGDARLNAHRLRFTLKRA